MISPVNAAKSILKPNGKLTMQNGVSNSGVPDFGGALGTAAAAT